MQDDKNSYKDMLKSLLRKYITSGYRIKHCIATAKFMKKYAKEFNLSRKKSYTSGLLHDLAKELTVDEILELSESFMRREIVKINNFDLKKRITVLLHGIASAELIVRELTITDKDVLEAICCHTFGGKNLSKLSQYTFMADFCEPERNYPPSIKVYKVLTKEKDFYKAYFMTYLFLIKRLIKKRRIIVMDSIEGYNEALALYKS